MKDKLQEIASDFESMLYSLKDTTAKKIIGFAKANGFVLDPEDYFYTKYGNGHLMDVRYRYQSEVVKVIERTGITIMLIRCYVEDIHENLIEEKYTVTVKFNTNETN